MTKEKPILFSGEMVRAILDCRKTQTRRVVKRRDGEAPLDYYGRMFWFADGDAYSIECPHGQPGDRLWVREAWLPCVHGSYEPWTRSDGIPNDKYDAFIQYKAESPLSEYEGYWRPSIHMPRWASRITLEVTKVRVERVQEIDEADSMAEGIKTLTGQFEGCYVFADNPGAMSGTTAKECYQRLWDAINAKRGFGWDANPWVWVIEFRRLTL